MSQPRLVTPPATTPVSLAEAKRHCRAFDGTDEDDDFTAAIAAATEYLDGYTGILGRCMIEQEWAVDAPRWYDCVALPFPNVSAVVVTYMDANDEEQTVSDSLYELVERARGTEIRFKTEFTAPALADDTAEPITYTMTVGYGATAANVPGPLKQAIKILVAHFYDIGREAVSLEGTPQEVPFTVAALIAPYRRRSW